MNVSPDTVATPGTPGTPATPATAHHWDVLPQDREFFDQHLRSFVPPDSFDAHGHMYRVADLTLDGRPVMKNTPDVVGQEAYEKFTRAWMGDRCPNGGLFFAFPTPEVDMKAGNDFIVEQMKTNPRHRGLMLIHPKDDPDAVEQRIKADGFVGVKVYHVYSKAVDDTMFAPTETFLPDWAWDICHRHGLAIMLHMVLPRAIADPRNQKYIIDRCLRYPNAKLILAHSARSFQPMHAIDGLRSIRHLNNIWFDTSGVCQPGGTCEAIRQFGVSRVMFGLDFPISNLRGTCAPIGDGFYWMSPDNVDWASWKYADHQLVGNENLLAMKQACHLMRLSDRDVLDLFRDNALNMLGIEDKSANQTGQKLYDHAKTIIPGGVQLLSKRPEMFAPDQWPAYFKEARGIEIVDLDGNRYLDMSICGIGACALGYNDPDVSDAAIRRIQAGSMTTFNHPEEVELAKLLCEIHPWAKQVRYARTGGESMSVAVRIARAYTNREAIAFCGYHGWHDWYIATNLGRTDGLTGHLLPGLSPSGVPASLTGTCEPFTYNKIDQLKQIIERHKGNFAGVVMEPTRGTDPDPGFLEQVRDLCHQAGGVLIFDEITIGWKMHLGGAHLHFGVHPDIAVFAKSTANGFPMGAIIGTNEVMQAAQGSFISSSFFTEGIGPAAALACIRKMQRIDLPAHLAKVGSLVQQGWIELGKQHKLPATASGRPCIPTLAFDHPDNAAMMTYLTAKMLGKGFLFSPVMHITWCHEPRHVELLFAALDPVMAQLKKQLDADNLKAAIGGPVKHSGFARLL